MKNKIIATSIFLSSLFILIPFAENIKASDSSYIQKFDTQTNGQPFLISKDPNLFMFSKQKASSTHNFICNSTCKKTGTLGFQNQEGSEGWFNFSYTGYLTSWATWAWVGANTGLQHTFNFYNDTLGISKPLIKFYIDYQAGYYRFYYYVNNVKTQLTINCPVDSWSLFNFNITSDVGACNYHVGTSWGGGDSVSSFVNNATAIEDDYRIDRLYLISGTTQKKLDDWNYTISTSYSGGTTYGCVDTSSDLLIGDIDGINGIGFDYGGVDDDGSIITTAYNSLITGTIDAVVLPIDPNYLDIYDDNLYNYTLSFYSTQMGQPVCAFSDNNIMYLEWDVDIELDEELVEFTFRHSWNNPEEYPDFKLYAGRLYEDLDGDGDSTYEGDFFGWWHDLYYGFYLEGDVPNPPPDIVYGDYLGCSGYLYSNATHTYVFDINSPIIIDYTISTSEHPYEISMWRNGTEIWDDVFPFVCDYPSGNIQYFTNSISRFNATLWYNWGSPRDNITIYVIGSPSDYRVWSIPAETFPYEPYTVYYEYHHGTNDGILGRFLSASATDSLDNTQLRYQVDDGSNGSIYYTMNNAFTEYWRLFVNNSYNTPVGNVHIHWVSEINENTLSVVPKSLEINPGNPEKRYVTVYYTHLFPGSDVNVKIGNSVYSCPNPDSSIQYEPSKTGTYTVQMYLDMDGAIQYLCKNITFSVTGEDDNDNDNGTGGNDEFGDIINTIPITFRYFAGILIVILFTLSPLLVITSIAKGIGKEVDISSIPQFVYMVMAVVGFVVVIIIGFLPTWSIAVLIAICVLIVTVLYLQRKNTSSA